MNPSNLKNVLVTGGAGYVGAVLVPKLLETGFHVKVLDLYLYGDQVLSQVKGHPKLEEIKGDIRDRNLLKKILPGCDAVIHLACISNDPSFELNPELGKSINLDAFHPLVEISRDAGVQRFLYASSSSVYGVKDIPDVTEEVSLDPLTDYSKFKAQCEEILNEYQSRDFVTCTLRPATVCGYSPRQRLDVVVNILTNTAHHTREIKVMGANNKRPNIHIQDMARAYLYFLDQPDHKINGKVFNVGCENHTVRQLAGMVREVVGPDVKLIDVPTNDPRSYHISSEKVKRELGFEVKHSIQEAILDLKQALDAGKLPNSLTDPRYFNIKTMQKLGLQ